MNYFKYYGYIYITTNNIDGKRYIGKSKYDKRDSEKYLGSGLMLGRAIKKYGENNFTKIIIDNAYNQDELNLKEIFWIEFYDACNSSDFYNIASGGDGGDTSRGHTEAQRKAITENRIIASKGKINLGAKNHCAKPVICLNTMEVFECGADAARKYGVCKEAIYDCCNMYTKTSAVDKSTGERLQWRWYVEGNDYSLNKVSLYENTSIKVRCINTGVIFDSIEKARKAYGVGFMEITKCCKGIKPSSGKSRKFGVHLQWEYA